MGATHRERKRGFVFISRRLLYEVCARDMRAGRQSTRTAKSVSTRTDDDVGTATDDVGSAGTAARCGRTFTQGPFWLTTHTAEVPAALILAVDAKQSIKPAWTGPPGPGTRLEPHIAIPP
jgi:hypothetical protein